MAERRGGNDPSFLWGKVSGAKSLRSDAVASRDLKRISELGLFVPHGEKRGRTYEANNGLLEIRKTVRKELGTDDPYIDPHELMADKSKRDHYLLREELREEPRLPGV